MDPNHINSTLFPGLGFFGANSGLMLRIPLGSKVFGIKLAIHSSELTYMNLDGVELYSGGARIFPKNLPPYIEEVSTDHLSNDQPQLLSFVPIHSCLERDPWWRVFFSSSIHIDEIRISNRPDRWSSRSKSLRLEAVDYSEDPRWRLLYKNNDEKSAQNVKDYLIDIGCIETGEILNPVDSRRTSLALLAARLLEIPVEILIAQKWLCILPIIDLWGEEPLSDHELIISSAFIFSQYLQGNDFSFSYLSAKLPSSSEIERLAAKINEMYGSNFSHYAFSRHGLQKQGRLIAKKDLFIDAARRVIHILEKEGLSPILAYGTLLGAVRDDGFIPHDDDLDILCRVEAYDFESARLVMVELGKLLESADFVVIVPNDTSLNIHVKDELNDIVIDLFPYWDDGIEAYLHMEHMRIRAIPLNSLIPRKQILLYGQMFPIPVHYENFLVNRYGVDWTVSRRYFEWPWSISEG